MLLVDQSGSTRFGEPLTKAVAGGRGRRGARAGGRAPERPGRRAALRRRGRARDPAAEGPPPRAAGHPRSRRVRAGGPAHQPGRQPVLRQPAAPAPEHRRRPLRLHRRGMGAAAPPARGAARGRRDHGGRSPRARAARRRAGSRCWTPRSGRRVLVDTGSREVRTRVGDADAARAARSGAGPSPRSGPTRCTSRPACRTRCRSGARSPQRARRIHRG